MLHFFVVNPSERIGLRYEAQLVPRVGVGVEHTICIADQSFNVSEVVSDAATTGGQGAQHCFDVFVEKTEFFSSDDYEEVDLAELLRKSE